MRVRGLVRAYFPDLEYPLPQDEEVRPMRLADRLLRPRPLLRRPLYRW